MSHKVYCTTGDAKRMTLMNEMGHQDTDVYLYE